MMYQDRNKVINYMYYLILPDLLLNTIKLYYPSLSWIKQI